MPAAPQCLLHFNICYSYPDILESRNVIGKIFIPEVRSHGAEVITPIWQILRGLDKVGGFRLQAARIRTRPA